MYVDHLPVGYLGIRTEIDENWLRWSGNIYYTIRPSERKKGYGSKMLEMALEECKKLGLNTIYLNASKDNMASNKVIVANHGILLKEDRSNHYKIDSKT